MGGDAMNAVRQLTLKGTETFRRQINGFIESRRERLNDEGFVVLGDLEMDVVIP